jgi:Tfp pilus assembly protein PilF
MAHQTGIRWGFLSAANFRVVAVFTLALAVPAAPQDTKPGAPQQTVPLPSTPATLPPAATSDAPHDPLDEAMALARKEDFDAAIRKYQEALQENPKLPDAYAGLARCYLKKKDVTQAYETVTKGLQVADSWPVRVSLGEVYFRQGKISEAEKEWAGVINSGHASARAYFGIARVRWAIENNKQAKAMVDKAYELDPNDPDIGRAWVGTLPRSERVKYYEQYLSQAGYSDAEERSHLESYLLYLKERAKQHSGPCRLVSKVTNTQTPLVRLLIDSSHLRGYGLTEELNGTRANLMLDTGASGIVVKRNIAEKAGIAKLTETTIGGVGDKGQKNAYIGTAKSIRVGQLEFQDCPVAVMESRSVADEEGLIGADVFADFLVEIDFPNEKLKLSELPKRPGQSDQQLALKNDEDDSDDQQTGGQATNDQQKDDPQTSQKAGATSPASAKQTAPTANSSGPQDRYIAPEMQSFTHIFRFGHDLLIPTKIGDAPSKLFLLDTGALQNSISPAAAREVTKVNGDPNMYVKGISGSVKNVYSADKAMIQFGHLRQQNQDMLSFDTTTLSDSTGTEISGFLGFAMLRLLDIKIDYRDALVDFSYDSKRFGGR